MIFLFGWKSGPVWRIYLRARNVKLPRLISLLSKKFHSDGWVNRHDLRFLVDDEFEVMLLEDFAGHWQENTLYHNRESERTVTLVKMGLTNVGIGFLLLLATITGCVGYVDGGGDGTVVVGGPEFGFFGGPVERGRDVHDYSHRGAVSRGVAHAGGGRPRGGRGGRKR